MSKWIDERAWNVSMYICYALCFIVLSVAGYNGITMLVGDVTLFMRAVLLICVCLFVALGVFLVFSVVITPFSELLNRLAVYLFEKKNSIPAKNDEGEVEVHDDSIVNDAEHHEVSGSADNHDNNKDEAPDSVRVALKEEFIRDYVRYDHQNEMIYEVFEALFSQKKSGAFAAHAFKCALNEKWLMCFPGYEAAKRLFPKEDSIKGTKSNYSNANNNNIKPEKEKEVRDILLNKFKELNPSTKDGQE